MKENKVIELAADYVESLMILKQLKSRLKIYEDALKAISKHQMLNAVCDGVSISTTQLIADKALEEIK